MHLFWCGWWLIFGLVLGSLAQGWNTDGRVLSRDIFLMYLGKTIIMDCGTYKGRAEIYNRDNVYIHKQRAWFWCCIQERRLQKIWGSIVLLYVRYKILKFLVHDESRRVVEIHDLMLKRRYIMHADTCEAKNSNGPVHSGSCWFTDRCSER